ncbi:hypothetical protein SAMD00019534_069800, partial [Acytostelium subglobosum LB1]|uniref:hypothetical protein n=1 Tax=Acytostelium subglobosum LB1 TaxID=1410327 RepID=UPI000644E1EB
MSFNFNNNNNQPSQVPSAFPQQMTPMQQQQQMPMQQQQQMQMPMPSFGNNNNYYNALPTQTSGSVRRLNASSYKKELPLCSMIITVNNDGSSYDTLYTSVEQAPPNANVSIGLWQVNFPALTHILGALDTGAIDGSIRELMEDFNRAEPSTIMINFECCGCCSDSSGFSNNKDVVLKLIRKALNRGYTVQFGDFATKALIKDWNTELLGPRAFNQIGTFSSSFDLKFNPDTLISCACAQLKVVGELCREKGSAHLHAMGGTVRFTVNKADADNNIYELQVLTVMTKHDNQPETAGHEVVTFNNEDHRGSVGHAILKYRATEQTPGKTLPSHGYLVVSAGHWIELTRLDTSAEAVRTKLNSQFGAAKATEFMKEYENLSAQPQQQMAFMQSNARYIVQSNAYQQ